MRILQRAVADGDRFPRALYYYAAEQRNADRLEEALAVYADYLADPGGRREAYDVLLSAARCAPRLQL